MRRAVLSVVLAQPSFIPRVLVERSFGLKGVLGISVSVPRKLERSVLWTWTRYSPFLGGWRFETYPTDRLTGRRQLDGRNRIEMEKKEVEEEKKKKPP